MKNKLFQKLLKYEFLDVLNKLDNLENSLNKEDYLPFSPLKAMVFYEFGNFRNLMQYTDKYKDIVANSPINVELQYYKTLSRYELGLEKNVVPILNTYYKELDQFDDTEYLFGIRGDINLSIGFHALLAGKFDKAKNYFEVSIKHYDLSDKKIMKSKALGYIALANLFSGHLQKSLYIQQKANNLIVEDYPMRMDYGYNNLGLIYSSIGNLDEANKNFEQALDLFLHNGKINKSSIPLSNLGVILLEKGDLSSALRRFRVALEIDDKYNNYFNLAESYYYIIIILLEMRDIDNAQKEFSKFNRIYKQSSNPIVHQRYEIIHALILKESSRYRDRAYSQEILYKIVNGKMLDFTIHVEAQFTLCNLLLEELQTTGNEEILIEIFQVLDQVHDHAKKENYQIILIKVYMLKSQLYLIQLQMDKVKIFLEKATELSKSTSSQFLDRKISELYDNFLIVNQLWEENDTLSISDRIKSINLPLLIEKMLYSSASNVIIQQEESAIFILTASDGTRIYSNNFNSPIKLNEDLTSGLMTAIFDLSRSIFRCEKNTMQRIKQGEYTIITKKQNSILFSYAFIGSSYHATKKLNSIINILYDSSIIWHQITRTNVELSQDQVLLLDDIVNEIFISLIN